MSLVSTLPGARGSKAQRVASYGGIRVMVPVTLEGARHSQSSSVLLEVALRSWRSLVSAPTEVPYLGLFLRRSLFWVCSWGGRRPRSYLAEVAVSGLILQRSLAQACPTEVASSGLLSEVALLYLLLQKSMAQAWSHGGRWLRPASAEMVHLAKRKF